jgi:hypothetical protein
MSSVLSHQRIYINSTQEDGAQVLNPKREREYKAVALSCAALYTGSAGLKANDGLGQVIHVRLSTYLRHGTISCGSPTYNLGETRATTIAIFLALILHDIPPFYYLLFCALILFSSLTLNTRNRTLLL